MGNPLWPTSCSSWRAPWRSARWRTSSSTTWTSRENEASPSNFRFPSCNSSCFDAHAARWRAFSCACYWLPNMFFPSGSSNALRVSESAVLLELNWYSRPCWLLLWGMSMAPASWCDFGASHWPVIFVAFPCFPALLLLPVWEYFCSGIVTLLASGPYWRENSNSLPVGRVFLSLGGFSQLHEPRQPAIIKTWCFIV